MNRCHLNDRGKRVRHPAPFGKTDRGFARRATRQWKRRVREVIIYQRTARGDVRIHCD